MKLAATKELHAYWREIKGARSAPERNDIDPGAIRGVLADTFILEFEPTAGFPMRIVGTRTNGLFQRELRGAPFLELWRRDDREEIGGVIETVCDEAQPFLIGAAGGPTDVDVVDVEVLLLPLRHRGATHARILGSCAPRRAPEWLGLVADQSDLSRSRCARCATRILTTTPPELRRRIPGGGRSRAARTSHRLFIDEP